jgi:hypothetical protein
VGCDGFYDLNNDQVKGVDEPASAPTNADGEQLYDVAYAGSLLEPPARIVLLPQTPQQAATGACADNLFGVVGATTLWTWAAWDQTRPRVNINVYTSLAMVLRADGGYTESEAAAAVCQHLVQVENSGVDCTSAYEVGAANMGCLNGGGDLDMCNYNGQPIDLFFFDLYNTYMQGLPPVNGLLRALATMTTTQNIVETVRDMLRLSCPGGMDVYPCGAAANQQELDWLATRAVADHMLFATAAWSTNKTAVRWAMLRGAELVGIGTSSLVSVDSFVDNAVTNNRNALSGIGEIRDVLTLQAASTAGSLAANVVAARAARAAMVVGV